MEQIGKMHMELQISPCVMYMVAGREFRLPYCNMIHKNMIHYDPFTHFLHFFYITTFSTSRII